METKPLPGTDLTVSTFALGTMQLGHRVTGEDMERLLTTYLEAGGNFFDTAHAYCFWIPGGDGMSERIVGDFIKRHGIRDQVVVATKGGHHPVPGYRTGGDDWLTARRISADIDDSLARLQLDTIDLFWLHRDDPRRPVLEILETLNEEVRRGRIRAFGGSNWTWSRLAEANRVAEENGLQPFHASQSRWNLAVMGDELTEDARLEPGALVPVNRPDRDWHAATGFPQIPYGPTANGFFAREAVEGKYADVPGAAGRHARARQLAGEKGCTPNQVALAWLLHQPFPVIPILGTSKVGNLRDALGAEEVSLTPEDLAFLEGPGT